MMKNNPNGINRLVLINSANYELAELPLDESVSLVGPNNSGKTSLINALQFLFIRERKHMDFGKHDIRATMKFYFPSPSSYILLEMQIPAGQIVVGCVGKGVSNDCQYFTYHGSLNINDFKNDDGSVISEPYLRDSFSKKDLPTVHYFTKPTEYFNCLYGISNEHDIRLFAIEKSKLIGLFQKVLVKTLNLDRLKASDLKGYLLQNSNADYSKEIEFNDIWNKAFEDVNAAQFQYDACIKLSKKIEDLRQKTEIIRTLRGRIGSMTPKIDEALNEWENYKKSQYDCLNNQKNYLDSEIDECGKIRENLFAQKTQLDTELENLCKQDDLLDQYSQKFFMVEGDVLEQNINSLQDEISSKRNLIKDSKPSDLPAIQEQIKGITANIESLTQDLNNGENLFKKVAQKNLSQEEMDVLNGLASRKLLQFTTDDLGDVEGFLEKFKSWLQSQGSILELKGLSINRNNIKIPFKEKSVEEIQKNIETQSKWLSQYKQQEEALLNIQAIQDWIKEKNGALKEMQCEFKQFGEFKDLQKNEAERKFREQEINAELAQNKEKYNESRAKEKGYRQQQQNIEKAISDLDNKVKVVENLKESRLDKFDEFANLLKKRYYPCQNDDSVFDLELALKQQEDDCKRLKSYSKNISEIFTLFQAEGFTKFLGLDGEDNQIDKIIEYYENREEEKKALNRDFTIAVKTVASILWELDHQYENFCTSLNAYNGLIRNVKISDLERLSVDVSPNDSLLSAVKMIAKHWTPQDNNPNLLNSLQENENDEVEKARMVLSQFCLKNGNLKLENLFDLNLNVQKNGGEMQVMTSVDDVGSNGTTLMAKMIFGLALLYMMSDKKKSAMSICYLDEAASIDTPNQKSLIEAAKKFNFNILFASPTVQNTAHYCVRVENRNSRNIITRKQWQRFEELVK
ncbi:MAG: SbcC/MukB-like Walker B domain-containing protein [Fibrobacter sp.]|uniref:SbcC/MukB-like Walker B domain-containing protein n=1 Tax=Fibrobacter sp. TaxID=35828 RepID=UPI002A9150FA|nr:SbcC/MukB-like Walker B domain-containing protein [Fibrobacter sp.]MDY6263868.1 SbcC/MukB-like Walker B domain-containing protein [Fibrobacter sp.]